MLYEYRIGFGIGERADGSPIDGHECERMLDQIKLRAAEHFSGFNLVRGEGGWIGGVLVCERSATLSIITDRHPGYIHGFASIVRIHATQHSVVLIHPDGSAEFIED